METLSTTPALLFDFLWVLDPTAWLGLLALSAIQVVLGIDNLLFIAILSAKLPHKQGNLVRIIGLGGALIARIILMIFASYVMAMSKPLFTIYDFSVSIRDLMMFLGGAFLIYKATEELHGKLEGDDGEQAVNMSQAVGSSFAVVATQITVLDVLFSADAIVTAVGMTNHVYIMIIAVTIAMAILMWAAGFITDFVSNHPTLVILCLGFLLLIGFSLIMEGLHIYVPKGYLYSAIGFSLLIEIFNQISRKNTLNLKQSNNLQSRQLAAHLVLKLLGSKTSNMHNLSGAITQKTQANVFNYQEKEMVRRVLQLSSLPVKAIMTARTDLETLNLDLSFDKLKIAVINAKKSKLIVYHQGQKDKPVGFIERNRLLSLLLSNQKIKLNELVQTSINLPETINILKALEHFKKEQKYVGFIYDEFGVFVGVITSHDITEEVTGQMPNKTQVPEIVTVDQENTVYQVDGDAVLADVEMETGLSIPPSEHYQTIAGFVLDRCQKIPRVNEKIYYEDWTIKVVAADNTSISLLKIYKSDLSNN